METLRPVGLALLPQGTVNGFGSGPPQVDALSQTRAATNVKGRLAARAAS